MIFFCRQNTAYDMRISDWSSDVCSSDLVGRVAGSGGGRSLLLNAHMDTVGLGGPDGASSPRIDGDRMYGRGAYDMKASLAAIRDRTRVGQGQTVSVRVDLGGRRSTTQLKVQPR